MFIISLTYIKPISEVEQHIEAHMAYLHDYYAKGVFVASGKKVPRTGGVILAQGQSRAEVESIAYEDPFYLAGLVDIEITEFIASLSSPELAAMIET